MSKTISFIRFPLTVGIVFIHFSLNEGLFIHGIRYGMDNPEWYFFIINIISQVFARVCVPLFYVISGFLFFYGDDFCPGVFQRKLKSRFRTLLIPFLIWNIIAVVWQMKSLLPGVSSYFTPVEIKFSMLRIFNTFFCCSNSNGILVTSALNDSTGGLYPIDVPLWFIRDLMVMVLFSPVIYWIIKRVGNVFLVLMCLLWFSSPLYIPKDSYVMSLITASTFFSIGASFSINKMDLVSSFQRWMFVPFIYIPIAIADALTKNQEYNVYFHKLGILVGIVSAVVLASCFVRNGKGRHSIALANCSFFIYALHFLFIGDLGKIAFVTLHVPDNNPYAMLALYFVVPIISVLICLGLYTLLKRYMPKVCNLLIGGR